MRASHFRSLENKVYPDPDDIPQDTNAQHLCIFDFTLQTDEAISAVKQLASQTRLPEVLLIRTFNSLDTVLLEGLSLICHQRATNTSMVSLW